MLIIITLILVILFISRSTETISINKTAEKEEIIGFCGNSNEMSSPESEMLFKNNCAACHAYDKRITGPALRGALNRWETKERLIGYITNEDSMIAIEDPYTLEIINFDPSNSNHSNIEFTKEELELIVGICSN